MLWSNKLPICLRICAPSVVLKRKGLQNTGLLSVVLTPCFTWFLNDNLSPSCTIRFVNFFRSWRSCSFSSLFRCSVRTDFKAETKTFFLHSRSSFKMLARAKLSSLNLSTFNIESRKIFCDSLKSYLLREGCNCYWRYKFPWLWKNRPPTLKAKFRSNLNLLENTVWVVRHCTKSFCSPQNYALP